MRVYSKLSLLILLGTFACMDEGKQQSNGNTPLLMRIQDVKFTDLKQQPVDMKQYEGRTVFINFWATWCKPCLEEMPTIQKAKEILKNEQIEFLFASDETPEQIEEFRALHEYPFNYFRVDNIEELNIMSLPATFIFDTAGKLAFSETGYRKWDDKTNIDLILKISKPK